MSELPAPAIPAVTGVLETELYVADLDRAESFFTTLLGSRSSFATSVCAR